MHSGGIVNNIKTADPNMADVARAPSRPSTYPTNICSCELGAQAFFDDKNEYLTPTTRMSSGIAKLVVKERVLNEARAHLKNPSKKSKKTDGTRGGVHSAAVLVPGDENSSASDDDSDDELTKKFKADSAVKARLEAFKFADSRLLLLETSTGNLGDNEDSDGDVNGPYTQFGCCIEQNRSEVGLVLCKSTRKAREFGIGKNTRLSSFLSKNCSLAKEVNTYKVLLAKAPLLGDIERLAGLSHLKPFVPKTLVVLYQIDVLTHWGSHVSEKYVDTETSK
ncbi:eukaryotic translation initiation factor 5 [Suillus cothurnatus]|nr:eukaryotic translation initiation factor 5 [Suillus cothurnatus]